MSDKVNYSIVKDNGLISVQSTVKSFNLDHVTNKDIVQFYQAFSTYAAYDTGLLPVEGSGILSIRSAGNYTQFAYQHKPGMYHINWGATEGDRYASVYYVAQPYRIIICDMKDGNLLGARMFYSPYPITSPSQILYHVNLPNINCRGYRGNGVGWICLYQNEDWSQLPLNERIVRFIERCSGVETYNDANMSETDGTRFYASNDKPAYLYDPNLWQQKSSNEGYEWTLDESLWIPVLVQSMDNQGEHYPNGVNLTFADALVGDYQAYYTDSVHTKPINALIRPDKKLSDEEVMRYYVSSYNATSPVALLNDTFQSSLNIKDKKGSSVLKTSPLLNNEPLFETATCNDCESDLPEGDMIANAYDELVCPNCIENSYIYIDASTAYYHHDDEALYYSEQDDEWYHTEYDESIHCDECETVFFKKSIDKNINSFTSGHNICNDCLPEYAEGNDLSTANCLSCNKFLITDDTHSINSHPVKYSLPLNDDKNTVVYQQSYFCDACVTQYFVCPCGLVKLNNSYGHDYNPCDLTSLSISTGKKLDIASCCASCLGPASFDQNGQLIGAKFEPNNPTMFDSFQIYIQESHGDDIQPLQAGVNAPDPMF